MSQVYYVAPDQIYQVWDKVVPYIKAANDVGLGYHTVDHTKLMLIKGMQFLLVSEEDSEITGALVGEFINYPNERVMHINELGGRLIIKPELLDLVEDWARQNGATRMSAWADEAQARLYKIKAGFTTARHVVEKKL